MVQANMKVAMHTWRAIEQQVRQAILVGQAFDRVNDLLVGCHIVKSLWPILFNPGLILGVMLGLGTSAATGAGPAWACPDSHGVFRPVVFSGSLHNAE